MGRMGNFRDVSTAVICSTLLSTTFLSTPVLASERAVHQASPGVSKSKSAPAASLPAAMKAELADALRQGERGLIAQVYDRTYRNPELRDAVLRHASGLAPSAFRDLTTAADLGVLTSGHPMALAPNAAQVLATRTAGASATGATSYQNVAMAVNNSPNLPSPLPSNYDQTWNLTMIGAPAAYARGFTGAGVNVTVADTGFDTTNAALVNKLRLDLGRNYVAQGGVYNTANLSPLSATDSHGTHVAGIVGAEKFDNVDMHGVAYDAMIIPLRMLTDKNSSAAPGIVDPSASALNYFATLNGTMVYNASYGPNYNGEKNLTQWTIGNISAEGDAAFNALKAGKIIVAANGNDRGSNPIAARNPSGLALMPFLNPAHANLGVYDDQGQGLDGTALQRQNGQLIAVMSVGNTKAAAWYSNLCGVTASWCVAAPGGDDQTGPEVYSSIPGNTYGAMGGTSMAAPTVSGAIAVLIQANPTYNAQDLSHLLFSTAEDLGAPGVDSVFGYGLIRLDRATDGPTTLAANTNVSVAANTTTFWSRLLNTDGDFTKTGDGILTIAGRTNAGGNVTAALGTLAVDGTLSLSAGHKLNVEQPATLAGFGTVNGDSVIAGTLSPGKMPNVGDLVANGSIAPGTVLTGNSVGSLTFNGNVTLTSTATTRIDIDGTLNVPGGPGTYDKIYVTGAGNVFYAAGTVTPVLRGSVGTVSNYTPAIGTEFAFVQAQNGARTAGTFSTLVQPTSGLPANGRFDLIYSPTSITLAVTPLSFSGLVSAGPRDAPRVAVARILDHDRVASGVMPGSGEKALFDALYNLDTEEQYDKALSQLGGPGQPAIASASLQAFSGIMGTIGDRQGMLLLGAEPGQAGAAQSFALSYAGRGVVSAETGSAANAFASIAPSERVQNGWSVWGQGFGRSSRVGDAGELAGSKTASGGFTVGADRQFSANLTAGGAFGYARTTATSTDIRGTSDTYAGALYASWTPGAAVVDVRVAAGPSQMTSNRQILLTSSSLQGSTNGVGVATSLEAGYRIPLATNVTLKPFAGINWQGFRRDGYSESQLPFGLVYAAQTYDKLTTTAGVALSARLRTTDGVTIVPEVKLAWAHDLRDTTLVSEAALLDETFTVAAAQPGRDAAVVGAKLSGWWNDNFRLFAAYNGEFRRNAESHQLSGGARFSW
ncbi:autotransporter domain-containing protein [Bradyrhizobium sp. U87765 SZCCT0131]|nr:autotransporter domain-containing protein [Bradyrhizobium sp. U87765 SZCCT0131]MBR1264978.1 autotransporter domain-containing protein [Bradyrhizobium sp. U87765 SZCCT0134]MBR1304960.1 autotransporter domain-containing protein [Bradyrhizobium sp. U87765 SZCCT0110]MBR1320746.1 autotransporter domain-containing protein [Bradyrhizobium sp. U87765 SZCCT0109]MBR1349166.1 autotransporter domain-containing protein [Bradyrhizobium sp. U87765 SZCCT0048]